MVVNLAWDGDLRFRVDAGAAAPPGLVLDSSGRAGPSPVTALAASLAGCMAIDLVHILTRGRHVVHSLQARLEGVRADEDPRRFVRMTLHFTVGTSAPPAVVERALALSREKYCSVWHSLRQDIECLVAFEIPDV